MNLLKILKVHLLISIIMLINPLYADEANDISWTYAEHVTAGIIHHEIGHYLIDVLDIPVFGNEEDIADSFMVYSILKNKSQFLDAEAYIKWVDDYHIILTETLDVYYFKTLLGEDFKEDVISHSSDKRRFYNLACFIQDGNEEYFNKYILERRIEHLLVNKCESKYTELVTSWSYFIDGAWLGHMDTKNKVIPIFEDTDDEFYKVVKDYLKNSSIINESLRRFPIELPQNLYVVFKTCGGNINAFYYPDVKEIVMCYEYVNHIRNLKSDVLQLKESL